jgi:hypothetical protein
MVPRAGVEPARGVASLDFESSASASSATPAPNDQYRTFRVPWAGVVVRGGRPTYSVVHRTGFSALLQGVFMTGVKGRVVLFGLLALVAAAAPPMAEASTYRWQVDASGNWNNPANWAVVEGPAGAGYPNLAGDVAVIDEPFTAARTITIPDGVTISIGRLTVAPSTAASQVTIARDGTGLLVFNNLGEDAVIETSGPGQRTVLTTPIRLAAHVNINATIDFTAISESAASRNVTIDGGSVAFIRTNTYTGTTTVADGELNAKGFTFVGSPEVLIPGPLVVGDGAGAASSAAVRIAGGGLVPSGDVQVNADGVLSFRIHPNINDIVGFHDVGELTVAGGKVLLEGGTLNTVQVQDLIMEGGEVRFQHPIPRLVLVGSLTATSTAASSAVVSSATVAGSTGRVELPSGNHDFTIADGPQAVDLWVETAQLLGGGSLTKRGPGVMRIDNGSLVGATAILGGTLQVNASAWGSPTQVDASATLTGSGTVGALTVAANGTVSPGAPVGALGSGSVAFTAGAHFAVEIAGGATYDRLNVTGTVNLANAILDLTSVFALPPGTAFTIIDNDGSDPVAGTFTGYPEGSLYHTPGGAAFTVSYHGGDGNDVTLNRATTVSYFLSEGATGSFFDEDVLIANPNTAPAPVSLVFLLPSGGTKVHSLTVPAQSRATVEVDEIEGLENVSTSVEVHSENGLRLAVERTMFWDGAHYGGHTANSVPRAELQWFFAEGAQNNFFSTYLLLANPGGAVTAKVTFLRENEPPFVLDVALPAVSRTTVDASTHPELVGRSFGIVVESPLHITAERAMYFASTPQRLWSGGHDNVGSPAPSTSWFHAEGASGTFFTTFILMSNPQTEPANVTLRFLLQGGTPVELTKTIPAQGRLTVNPAAEGLGALENAAFSTVVTSNVPIVSERAMYWSTDDTVFGEGHASSGLTTTALDWLLAEGRVGGPFAYTTYILLANPQSSDASVKVTFLRESGAAVVKNYTVLANSRFNIDVGGMVTELQNESFGALIEVTNNVPIAVERSMYWNVEGRFWSGGTNAVGTPQP